jgi:hypothetical protein
MIAAAWPWLALILLGAWHGLNPGMGWLLIWESHAFDTGVESERETFPAVRRSAGAASTPAEGRVAFGRVLCCSSVEDHSGYSPSSPRAPSQNLRQRYYTSLGNRALIRPPTASSPDALLDTLFGGFG